MKNTEPSVLACVTCQYDCDIIINAARKIADGCGCKLKVLSVVKPMKNYSSISNQIEYLHLVSKQAGADMTVLFSENPSAAAAGFAKENNVQRIVTGMHDGGSDSFLIKFNELQPLISISMVSKDKNIYSMDLCTVYS